LHFYIIDVQKNGEGLLSYEIGIRSLDGSGPHKRGLRVDPPEVKKIEGNEGYILFTVTNTGEPAATDPSLHHQNTSRWLTRDIYRLSVAAEGKGCSAQLGNALLSLEPGETGEVPVYISFSSGASRKTKVTLTVRSESDVSQKAVSSISIKATKF
jgi:hypothetical protein